MLTDEMIKHLRKEMARVQASDVDKMSIEVLYNIFISQCNNSVTVARMLVSMGQNERAGIHIVEQGVCLFGLAKYILERWELQKGE